ncbi:MAG: NAD(P)/FAD-dependent oxidoreductase [Myxococcota bacterium]|nr:NAD(P)/FAD-dependent oxidoreductase [Myxococcota bacterium]
MNGLRSSSIRPITESEEAIRSALAEASIPTLLAALIHLTGDHRILKGPIRPETAVLGDTTGGLSEADSNEVREQALQALIEYRDAGCPPLPEPPPEIVHEMMSFVVGQEVPERYVPMMLEELALGDSDMRSVNWSAVPEEARKTFHVAIIGAGMSGLLTAIQLGRAGIPYTVFEKNESVGGTWYENSYPGCRVDIGNHFYCYSFEPNSEWSEYFAQQPELQNYFEHCADKYEVRDRIRFNTEILKAQFQEDSCTWELTVQNREGQTENVIVQAVVSAVGQLNRPRTPEIQGLENFEGACFHSASWNHDHSLENRRVALVGTGASAFQIGPELAKIASHLSVFQRSPAWMFPNPDYHRRVENGKQWLLAHVPFYARWYRFLLFWPGSDGLMPSLIVDPNWPHPERSVNALNDEARIGFTEYIESQLSDHPELVEKVVPRYPPFGKRMLQDNGSWLATLKQENVSLITESIDHVESHALVTEDGISHDIDAIVFATGFHANRFLWPIEVIGRSGAVLSDVWGDDPKAYLGITIPHFPNFFCLYGPATNLAHAGSIIFHSECQVRYILGCLKALFEQNARALDCRETVNEEFNQRLEEALSQTVWAHPGVNSWYKNESGRVTATSPWLLADYWEWTRHPNLGDYEILK